MDRPRAALAPRPGEFVAHGPARIYQLHFIRGKGFRPSAASCPL
jgi:hypothetical protein